MLLLLLFLTVDVVAALVVVVSLAVAVVVSAAVIGALVLGWTESFATGYVSSDYEDVFAFSLLVLILIFKPAGILGKNTTQKV